MEDVFYFLFFGDGENYYFIVATWSPLHNFDDSLFFYYVSYCRDLGTLSLNMKPYVEQYNVHKNI
jgi:hypothetical protein